jgi:hypothetical protein
MKKEKEEDLDKLFKSGIGDPVNEPVYREADWDAMEQILDKRKKRGGMIFWLPLIGTAAALILLFLGLWLYKPQAVTNNGTQHASVVQRPKRNTGTGGGTTVPAADSSKHKILNPANYAQSATHPVQGKKGNSFLPLSAGGSHRHTSGYASNNKAPDKKEVGTADATANNPATRIAIVPKHPDKKDLGTADAAVNNLAANIAVVPNKPDNKDLSNGHDPINNPVATSATALTKAKDSSASNSIAATPAPKVKIKSTGKPNPANRAVFALSALASSDLNGSNPLQGGRIGGNFGGLFSVTVNKWTFSTGAMYSIKPYQESYANYHTSYVFQTNPTNIGVNCRMIDIPFDVNYQVYRAHADKVTIGSGLSSYIILREDYKFNYATPYTYGPAGYSVVNQNRNIFGVLNLDATYEHQINSKFGIAFQPYVKLPFSTVGASQARLQSTGVAVSLNWNLNPFRKPN